MLKPRACERNGERKFIILIFIIMENWNYQIADLTLTEQREVNGGVLWEKLVYAALVNILNDWDNFKAGLAGKPEIEKK
jgi:hypothetical protein